MNYFRYIAIASLLAWLTIASASANAASTPMALPTDSIYRLDLPLVDQDARALKLADRRGEPVLIAMFYTSCPYTCPLIIDTIKRVKHDLGDVDGTRLRVLLVSFDSVRDTPQVLKATAASRHLDGAHWTLARTDASGVRKLAALLGVQYRALSDGNFNHSNAITLLDADGRIAARSDRVGEPDGNFVEAAHKVLGSKR